ncbi:MAG TPA: NAD-dependent epimerase/dehydratase family protein [Polyangiales bacterium]|nr:NAD-dependent epimerase/dehydratase family protein [Polyangiales bacterium]
MEHERSREIHVVLGAGQVGPHLAARLAALGHDVRMVSRTQPKIPAGVRWVSGDLTDGAFAREVVRGAAVVYHCANPMRYDQWASLLPPLSDAILAALSGSEARLVMLDNLYMYGAPARGVIDDATPMQPQSGKGALRAELAERFAEAERRGAFELSVLRAPDFFGVDTARSAVFHPIFAARLARGKSSPVLGDPDLPHAHAYVPDVARALALLGTHPVASREPWLGPVTWNGSVRELFAIFARLSEKPVKPWQVPSWLWPVLGLWDPELRGVPEMLHQWNVPFAVDDSRFRAAFDFTPTPIERAVSEVLTAYGLWPAALQHAA